MEFAGQCTTSCPTGFQTMGNICEECNGLCQKGDDAWNKDASVSGTFLHGHLDAMIFILHSECDGRKVTDPNSDISDLFECTIIKGDLLIDILPPSWK